jgi:hypothetical protein
MSEVTNQSRPTFESIRGHAINTFGRVKELYSAIQDLDTRIDESLDGKVPSMSEGCPKAVKMPNLRGDLDEALININKTLENCFSIVATIKSKLVNPKDDSKVAR